MAEEQPQPEQHQPALPNMPWIQQTWDGLLAITTSPLLDFSKNVPRSVPILGAWVSVVRGIVSGVLQYSGDPKLDAAAEKAVGCSAYNLYWAVGLAAIAVPPWFRDHDIFLTVYSNDEEDGLNSG